MVLPYISVVVVAYDAEDEILDCLESLMNQSYSKENYEIIVVVDDEATYRVIKDCPIVVHHRKVKGNIPSARNLGIKLSKGEIIAYTDSDCIVPVNWLENIARSFEMHPNISGVGGLIKPYSKDAVSLSLALLNMVGYASGNLSFETPFPTSNAAYKKVILEFVNGFDEKASVGEDMDLYKRIKENNFHLLFDPSIHIYHKHRTTLKGIFKWCINAKKKASYISKKYPSRSSLLRQITPVLISILFIALSMFFFPDRILPQSLLLFVFVIYLFIYLKYGQSEYLNLYSFFVLPIVVLTISSAFLCGHLSVYFGKNKYY